MDIKDRQLQNLPQCKISMSISWIEEYFSVNLPSEHRRDLMTSTEYILYDYGPLRPDISKRPNNWSATT